MAKVTKAILEDICVRMAEGNSLRSICKDIKLNEATVRYHLMKNEDAFTHSARARELGCDALADECLEIADDKAIDAADKRIMIDTRIRLIGKWSQRYGDKLSVTNKTEVTHKYDLDRLSDDQLDKLEAILADAGASEGGEGEAQPSTVH